MPVRTCVATHQRKADTELLRLVVDPSDPDRVIPDPRRRLPGRGAWITPDLDALDLACQRRAIQRALRVSAETDTGQVREYLADPDLKRKTDP